MLKLDRLEISGFKSFVDPVSLAVRRRHHRHRRPQRLRQEQPLRGHHLGARRAERQEPARRHDGGRHLQRLRQPPAAGDGGGHPDACSPIPTSPGAEDGRMTLSRRVFRSGESQYRLNGKLVRLKDFRDLLMDTGLRHARLLGDRAGQDRPDPLRQAAGATQADRRGGRRHPLQGAQEGRRGEARGGDRQPAPPRTTSSPRSSAPCARSSARPARRGATRRNSPSCGRSCAACSTVAGPALAARADTVRTEVEAEEARELELAARSEPGRQRAQSRARRIWIDSATRLSAKHRTHAETVALIEGRQSLIRRRPPDARRDRPRRWRPARPRRAIARPISAEARSRASPDSPRGAAISHPPVPRRRRRSRTTIGGSPLSRVRRASAEVGARRTARPPPRFAQRSHRTCAISLHREQIEAEKGSYPARAVSAISFRCGRPTSRRPTRSSRRRARRSSGWRHESRRPRRSSPWPRPI